MRLPRIFATIGIESFMREHRKKRKRKEALSMNDELTAQDIQKMQAELDDELRDDEMKEIMQRLTGYNKVKVTIANKIQRLIL